MKLRIHRDELLRHGRHAAAAMVSGIDDDAARRQAESLVLPPLEKIAVDADGFVSAEHVAILARVFEAQSEALHAAAFAAFCRSKDNN